MTLTLVSLGRVFKDFTRGFGSDEGFWVGVSVFQVFHDRALEFGNALEGRRGGCGFGVISAKKRSIVSRGRREVQMEAGVCLEPKPYGHCLFGGVVVNDQMEIGAGRGLMINQLETAKELSVPMPRDAVPITLPFSMLSAANMVVVRL